MANKSGGLGALSSLAAKVSEEMSTPSETVKTPAKMEISEPVSSTDLRETILFSSDEIGTVKGMPMRLMMEEMMKSVKNALSREGISSFNINIFGQLLTAVPFPKDYFEEYYEFCNEKFLVIKEVSREISLYERLVEAAKNSPSGVFCFPMVEKKSVEIAFDERGNSFPIEVEYLNFTLRELKNLNYYFVTNIRRQEDPSRSDDKYFDAKIVFSVDKEKLESHPVSKRGE